MKQETGTYTTNFEPILCSGLYWGDIRFYDQCKILGFLPMWSFEISEYGNEGSPYKEDIRNVGKYLRIFQPANKRTRKYKEWKIISTAYQNGEIGLYNEDLDSITYPEFEKEE